MEKIKNEREFKESGPGGQKHDPKSIEGILIEEQTRLKLTLDKIEANFQGNKELNANKHIISPELSAFASNIEKQTKLLNNILLNIVDLINNNPEPLPIKLKFDETKNIENFLSQIDSVCEANGIKEDGTKVKIALAAIITSEHGVVIAETVNQVEKHDWSLFKAKLTSILGRDYEHYDDLFSRFKRKNLSPGLALAQMCAYYKKSFPVRREILNEDDKRVILRAFIRSLEQPIKGLIRAEEHLLNLDTVANRVQKLERAYNITNIQQIETQKTQ